MTLPAHPTPPVRQARPITASPYPRALAERRQPWWKLLVVLAVVTLGLQVLGAVLTVPVVALEVVLGARTATSPVMTPAVLAASLVALGLMIPVSFLTQRWLYGVGALTSVHGRVRWRLLLGSSAILLGFFALYMGGANLLAPPAGGEPVQGETIAFAVIVVLLVPLQSAGEEYAFRGLAFRAITAAARRSRFAVAIGMLGNAVVFAALHFAEDLWLNAYYLLLGLCLSAIVLCTGGLEVSVAVHAANNVVAFLLTVSAGEGINLDRSAGTGGPFMLVQMGVMVAVTLVVWLLTRRRRQMRRALRR